MNLNSKVADPDKVFGGRPHTVNTEFPATDSACWSNQAGRALRRPWCSPDYAGLATKHGTKATGTPQPKRTEATATNAEVTGAGAQRREPKAVRFWRPVDRLVNGRSPPWLSLETQAACTLPESLHQLDGWRKELERKSRQPDYRLRRTAPKLGHAMNTNTADYCGNQTRQRIFRPWRSLE